jgi:urease accessory protein UreF
MLEQRQVKENSWSEAADWRALEEQLGSPEEATAMSGAALAGALQGIRSAEELRNFVAHFQIEILGAQELPIILRSYNHARRNEGREIIQLDLSLKEVMLNEALAAASVRVGRNQLRRMRALRHEKAVSKYWDAVRNGEASAWHTVVFGVVLAVYSIPLRQGLHHYSQQTVRGFLEAGARSLRLREAEVDEMEMSLVAATPRLVEKVLAPALDDGFELRCV